MERSAGIFWVEGKITSEAIGGLSSLPPWMSEYDRYKNAKCIPYAEEVEKARNDCKKKAEEACVL
jgi:hypothetical protein